MKRINKNSSVTLVELPCWQFGEFNGDRGYDIYSRLRLPSRALHYLEAILNKDGWNDVKSVNPLIRGVKGKIDGEDEARIYRSDVLGISSITRTSPQSMNLARRYKEVNPNGIVISGGFDPTFRAKEWVEKGNTDIVVIGEGDETFKQLMNRLIIDPKSLSDVEGIAYKKDGNFTQTNPRKLLTSEELSNLPLPYYDERARKALKLVTLETTRGCPYNCNFCTVTNFYGGSYRAKSREKVIGSLEDLRDIKGTLFITDDNFTKNPQIVEILEEMAERGLNKRWGLVQASVDVARNPKIISALKKAGIKGLCLGIESINNNALKSMRKPFNANQNREYVKLLRDEGFWIHGMLVAGEDEDTPESLREMSNWANISLDSMQLFALTPIPGSDLRVRMEKEERLIDRGDMSLYDGQMVVFRPKNFTPLDLQMGIYNVYKSFYSSKNMARRFVNSSNKMMAFGIFAYLNLWGGKMKMFDSPQVRQHLDYLKSLS